MTARVAPPWLSELQAAFGALLQRPLDRSTGTLRARTEDYRHGLVALVKPGSGLDAGGRLAVYHRQYWFRLLTALQDDFPLLARLLGFWEFNGWAARYLVEAPPGGSNLQRAGDAFPAFLQAVTGPGWVGGAGGDQIPRAALLEAAAIDGAWRAVLAAPAEPPLEPAGIEASSWPSLRLRPRACFAVVEEHWPLCELRRRLAGLPVERAAPLPPRHGSARWFLVGCTGASVLERELGPLQARLLRLLGELPVGQALARLEAGCDEAARRDLPGLVERWLAEAVGLGYFAGEAR